MRPIAEKHGTSVAGVALAYVLAKPFVTSVITGAKRLDQIQQNLVAVERGLDRDDLAALDTVSALVPEYPGWMIERTAPTCMPAGKQIMPGTLPATNIKGVD